MAITSRSYTLGAAFLKNLMVEKNPGCPARIVDGHILIIQ